MSSPRRGRIFSRCYRLGLFTVGCAALASPSLAEPSVTEALRENPLVQQAVADLARRKAVLPASVELVSYQEVTWPDPSLGCPHPDMRYRQVPRDGAKIVLGLAGGEYAYHSGGGRAPFLCQHKVPNLSASPPSVDN